MVSRSLGVRITAVAVLVVVAGLMSVLGSSVKAQPSPCGPLPEPVQCENEMSVSSAGPVGIGLNATVDVSIDSVTTDYAGYGAFVDFPSSKVNYVACTYTALGAMALPAACTLVVDGGGAGIDRIKTGNAKPSGTTNETGVAVNLEFQCVGAGTAGLTLVPPAGAVNNSTTLGIGGVLLETGLTAGEIVCEQQADVQVTKDGGGLVVAGSTFDYVITMHNAGPNAATMVTLGDNLPELIPDDCGPDTICGTADDSPPAKEYVSHELTIDGNPYPFCAFNDVYIHPITGDEMLNIVLCDLSFLGIDFQPSMTAVLTITVSVPLYDAGKYNYNVAQGGSMVTVDPNEDPEADCALLGYGPGDGNLGCDITVVLPAELGISKVADNTLYSVGGEINWTVTVTCLGPSPCDNISITDVPGANQAATGADSGGACTENVAANLVTCDGGSLAVGNSIDLVVTTDVIDSVDTACVNDASVEGNSDMDGDSTPEVFSTDASVLCFPPTVRMQKDVTDDPLDIVNEANLWLCEGPTCVNNGEGQLVIVERVFNVNNDPDGAGAYEFQLKFDHKIFDIEIEDASWLSNGGTRDVQCNMSVITENWILFGCVSTGPVPGNTSDGVLATITIDPEDDLRYRLTPGNDNGMVRVLLDENCEIADPLGHPLEIAGWANDGIDNDGDTVVDEFGEGLAPGVVTGGIIEECSDFSVTVRILEADLNLDCSVDVLDQQAIAFRYGASGVLNATLLYDPWFDLEPWVKDADIDIKDLQKVFGRDGSTCAEPLPPQPPVNF